MRTTEQYTDWRKKRAQKGLCPECGVPLQPSEKKLCQKCKDYHRDYMQEYSRRPDVKEKHRLRIAEWQRQNPQKVAVFGKAYRFRLREDVLKHYGSKCACCGEDRAEFLTLDHVNNDGNKHRQQLAGENSVGIRVYSWVRRNGYPDDFQVLCWNCNEAKAHYGYCPHQKAGTVR